MVCSYTIQSMDPVFFFGYGAYRNREKIRQVIGRNSQLEFGAILEGYQLCFQSITHIPQKPQEILRYLYGESFKAYTVQKGEGIVAGVVYKIEQEDLENIRKWEFVGLWREIIAVSVRTAGEKTIQVLTEKAMNDTVISETVDGLCYDEFQFTQRKEKQKEFYTKEQLTYIRRQIQNLDK